MASMPQGGHPLSTEGLLRSLLSLPELGLRLGWLRDKLTGPGLRAAAPGLDELAQLARAGEPRAREALLAVAVFLVQERETSLVWALREAARATALLDLERLLREDIDQPSLLVEGEISVPNYGTGRELTVGERRSLARRPTRLQLERLLMDPHPLVLDQLMQCPRLTEDDVLRLLTKRPARLPAFDAVARSPRWLARRRVRLALIQNPGCPGAIAIPLLAACPRDDLASIVSATTLSRTVRTVAHELLSRLPPVHVETQALQ